MKTRGDKISDGFCKNASIFMTILSIVSLILFVGINIHFTELSIQIDKLLLGSNIFVMFSIFLSITGPLAVVKFLEKTRGFRSSNNLRLSMLMVSLPLISIGLLVFVFLHSRSEYLSFGL